VSDVANPNLAVVAFGGGHGLAATLSALRLMTNNLTAVVTVADDGGSSGRLRGEMEVLPPGDLRMALSALCDDTEWGRTWRDLLQYRYRSTGPLDEHAVGNLLIVGLCQLLGDPVDGLDWVGRLLNARGRVLPMCPVPLVIEADMRFGDVVRRVRGQEAVAIAPGQVEQLWLTPEQPPATPQAVEAIEAADWVIFGPGSWYTSVIPHLLVPGLVAALRRTKALRCLTLNLSAERLETAGMTAADHVAAWRAHADGLCFDAVLADPTAIDDMDALCEEVDKLGAHLILRQLRVGDGSARHDPLRLAAAFRDIFDGFLGDVGERSREC
jgi:uncharacterized cofD-like protein